MRGMHLDCECGQRIDADDLEALEDVFLVHVRAEHPEWPFPDRAVRNYAAATQRLTGGRERLDSIGTVEVHPVTEDRVEDWTSFFDHDGFVGTPEWAGCYCTEPHVLDPKAPVEVEARDWQANRELMRG